MEPLQMMSVLAFGSVVGFFASSWFYRTRSLTIASFGGFVAVLFGGTLWTFMSSVYSSGPAKWFYPFGLLCGMAGSAAGARGTWAVGKRFAIAIATVAILIGTAAWAIGEYGHLSISVDWAIKNPIEIGNTYDTNPLQPAGVIFRTTVKNSDSHDFPAVFARTSVSLAKQFPDQLSSIKQQMGAIRVAQSKDLDLTVFIFKGNRGPFVLTTNVCVGSPLGFQYSDEIMASGDFDGNTITLGKPRHASSWRFLLPPPGCDPGS